jgi:hypothetical protein
MASPLLPATAWIKTWDTGESVKCGATVVQDHTNILYLRILLYKHGTAGGSEQVRAKIYSDANYTKLMYTSAWASVADVPNMGTNWWGWFRLTFAREALNKNATYYVALETQNYTRNADTFYLSNSLDWPVAQNTQSAPGMPGAAMQIYGYRDLSL